MKSCNKRLITLSFAIIITIGVILAGPVFADPEPPIYPPSAPTIGFPPPDIQVQLLQHAADSQMP